MSILDVLMAVNIQIILFLDVMPCLCWKDISVLEKHASFTSKAESEHRGSRVLQKIGTFPSKHSSSSQNSVISVAYIMMLTVMFVPLYHIPVPNCLAAVIQIHEIKPLH
jgi:hypothetical protein